MYISKVKNIEDKIPGITNATLKTKINEVKSEMPIISDLATTATTPTVVGRKIPNVSNLVKNTGYSTTISQIKNKIFTNHDHDKYITTQEFNKLTAENCSVILARVL